MSVKDQLESIFNTAKSDIAALFTGGPTMGWMLQVAAHIKADVAVVEGDITTALKWVASNLPAIEKDLGEVVSVAQALAAAGLITAPEIAPILVAAQAAVTALQAVANDVNAGKTNSQTIVDGVGAINSAAAAKAQIVLN